MDRIINLRLLSHPMNWLIVWSVLLLASAFFVAAHNFMVPPMAGETPEA